MSDSPPPPSLNAPEWELRRRNAQSLSQDHAEAATPPTPTAAAESWHAQLAEARRAMAAKLEQQAQEDDERARASAEGAREAAATGRRDDSEEASEGSHRRRVSVASSEGDDELVEQLLRPRSTPTSAPVQEDEARQADADSSSAEPPAPQGPPPPQDDRVCRICFGGADDEEELGRLFSPCVCRGTSRHVHTKCLESWRKTAVNPRAFYQCPMCLYQYRFRRTTLARAITSPLTVTFLTSLVFALIVFLSGFLANSLIAAVEARQSLAPSLLNDLFIPDHILAGEGIREAVSFVEHRLEQSRWVAGRDLALERAAQDDSSSYRFFNPSAARKAKGGPPQKPPFVLTALLHAVKGSALLGIMSTFYAYAAATFMSPLGRTLFRALRPAGGRRRGADRAASMSQLVVLFLIVVGVIKSIRQVYRGVKWLTRVALSRVEDLVIEVNA
ncbi:hypothetical protein DMC30DRAFT_263120 [Rhodotorula diobovata]|uniref:RING-CH-type domain-containing protein n=1 Tax=Rhodotorula diobovata TaxID=5288 RepID=A0A5C5FTN8_9BASI|nr:hypothetical protein DMC30DRAFT_263120 [Rhodotorula diobovata]